MGSPNMEEGSEVEIARLRAENERLRALVADYENGIDWHVTCTNCAKLLDGNYDQFCEIERLRAAGDALADALDTGNWTADILPAAEAWQEARRER